MSDHEDKTITEENAPLKVVPQITTVTNISTKFPYLKKGEYDIWAMKMQNLISSSDLLCWNILLKGNCAKSMTTDNDANLKIRPPVTAEEHQQVQREEKARVIWNAIKARFGRNAESKKMQKSLLKQKFEEFKISEEEGLDKGYDKMQKILTQMNTLKIKPEQEDVNMKFLRGLPPSWSGIALILKTKGGLKYISFDDLYNKLKFLKIDTKGYSSSFSTLSNAAFVSTTGSSQGNLSYQELGNGGYTTTLSVSLGSLSSKGSSKSKCSVVDDVIYSFFANHEIDQHLVYEDLDQMNKEEFEEYDLKHQMVMISIKGNRAKSMTTDNDANLKIRPPVTAEEHQQKFEEFKISEEEGLDKGYDKMQKILTQMNTLKIKPKQEDVNMKFLKGLPPSWSGIALILKTKGGLKYISFDDLYNKLKFLKIDTKGYSSSSSTLSNAAFVSTTGSSQGNLSYQESRNGGYTTTLSVSLGSSSSKGSSKSKCSVVDDVIYSFFANHEIDQHLVYEDLDQMNKEEVEEYDLKHQMVMLSIK
nr:hypothetical protein [Tanacetum cinerariifolium]